MKLKIAAIMLVFAGASVPLAGQASAPARNPLQRQYREGETLAYRMNAVNENWRYTVQADGAVKKDSAGTYFEEFRWSKMESGGQPLPLSPQTAEFRQRLTLDPSQNPSVPDFTKVDPKLIGPMADFMTFYSDLWLAIKTGQLTQPGDHVYVPNGVPNSWADGTHVLLGQSAIDFDLTLKSIDKASQSALLSVRHVPPAKSTVQLPAAWMQTQVGDRPNNWVGVQKDPDGKFTASVGEEVFTVEIKLSLADGKILSATMDNPVKTVERTCEDQALTKCSDPKPHEILRKIEISLVQ
jgi:hypothetical protein